MIDIHDIKPVLHIAATWFWWISVAAALIILSLALVWWWFRRRGAMQGAALRHQPAPHEQAFAEIAALGSEKEIDGKAFYFRLSAILRRYIERRFGLPAAEMTVEELLPCLARLPLPVDLAHRFELFSRSAEPIKFAAAAVDPALMRLDLDFARTFVERTTPGAAAMGMAESGPGISAPVGQG
jgi:hypothetical protein